MAVVDRATERSGNMDIDRDATLESVDIRLSGEVLRKLIAIASTLQESDQIQLEDLVEVLGISVSMLHDVLPDLRRGSELQLVNGDDVRQVA